ncbi:hypothetical protein [Lamprocystis purpurea]|jgi:hypothetical protein|nr:hypothetical protein [Lamprocystis purpurea]
METAIGIDQRQRRRTVMARRHARGSGIGTPVRVAPMRPGTAMR